MEEAQAIDVESAALLSSIADHSEPLLDQDLNDFVDSVKSNYAFVNRCKAFVRFVSPTASPRERFEAFLLLPTLVGLNSDELQAIVPHHVEIKSDTNPAVAQFARRFGSPSILATILSSINYSPIENFTRIAAMKCTPPEGVQYFEPAALTADDLHAVVDYLASDKSRLLLDDVSDLRGRRVASLQTAIAPETPLLERVRSLMSDTDVLKLVDKKGSPNLFAVVRETILASLQASINHRTTRSASFFLYSLEKSHSRDLHGELINAAFAAVIFPKSLGAATEDAQITGAFGYDDMETLQSFAQAVVDAASDNLQGGYPDGFVYGTGAQVPRLGSRKSGSKVLSPGLAPKQRKRKSLDTDSSSTGLGSAEAAFHDTSAAANPDKQLPPSPKRPKLTETTEEDAVDGIAALSHAAASAPHGRPDLHNEIIETKDAMDVDLSAVDALVGVRSGGNLSPKASAEDLDDVDGTIDEEEEAVLSDQSAAVKRGRGRPRRASVGAPPKPAPTPAEQRAAAQDDRPRRANAGFKKLDTTYILPLNARRAAANRALQSMTAVVSQDEKFESSLSTRMTKAEKKALLAEEKEYHQPVEAWTQPLKSSVVVLPNKRYRSKQEARSAYMKAYREQRLQREIVSNQHMDVDEEQQDQEAVAAEQQKATRQSRRLAASSSAPATPVPSRRQQQEKEQHQPQQSSQTQMQAAQSPPHPTRTSSPTSPTKSVDPDAEAVKGLVSFFQSTCSAAQVPYDNALLEKSARSLVAEGVTREGLLMSVIDAQTASGLASFLQQKKLIDVVIRSLVVQRFGDAGKMHFSVKIESTSADAITQCVSEFETFFKKSVENEGRVFDGAMSTASRLFADAVFKKFQVVGPRDLVEQLELNCIDIQELKDLGLNRRLLQLLQKEVELVRNPGGAASTSAPLPPPQSPPPIAPKPAIASEETEWTKSMKAMLGQTAAAPAAALTGDDDGTHPHSPDSSKANDGDAAAATKSAAEPFPMDDGELFSDEDFDADEDDEDVRRDLMESVAEVTRSRAGASGNSSADSSLVKAARLRQRAVAEQQRSRPKKRDPPKRRRGRPRKADLVARFSGVKASDTGASTDATPADVATSSSAL